MLGGLPFTLFSQQFLPQRLGLALRLPRRWHWLLLVLGVLAGASLNLYRTAWWPSGDVQRYRGFYVPDDVVEGRTVRWARAYAKLVAPRYHWAPQRWRLELIAPPAAGPEGAAVTISMNGVD